MQLNVHAHNLQSLIQYTDKFKLIQEIYPKTESQIKQFLTTAYYQQRWHRIPYKFTMIDSTYLNNGLQPALSTSYLQQTIVGIFLNISATSAR